MMTSLEQLLRDAMDEHTSSAPPVRTGMAHAALRGSRRTRRLQTAAVGGTSVAAAAVVVASASLGGGSGTAVGTPGAAAVATTTTPAPAPTTAPTPWVVGATFAATPVPAPVSALASGPVSPNDPAAKSGGHGPAALDAVTLPDPAPGFPLRRWADRPSGPTSVGVGNGTYWTKDFGVGVTPYLVSADGMTKTPTGPEATIMVIDAAPKIDGTVVGHTHVGSQAAVLVDYDNMHILGFSAGKFTVQVWGTSTVTSDQLVALASALKGLPS